MTTPQNVLLLVDLLARLSSAGPDTPVVTDHNEALMTPMAGMSLDPTEMAEITIVGVPMDASDVQTAATVADLLAPFATREASHENAGLRSPVVIAPYGDAARWVTDVSYENGRLTLHTVRM